MKKILSVAAMIAAIGTFVFADTGLKGAKETVTVESSDVQKLQLAYDLADYGYAEENASSLLKAAEILISVKKQEAEFKATLEGTEGQKAAAETKTFTPEALVKDAKAMLGKDKSLNSWISSIEKSMKVKTRGASGGARYVADFAYANGGCTYYDWYFDGGRLAEVGVHSMDGADLDLFIYDENGNFITSDERVKDGAYCSFTPKWTGLFRIYVKNNASYNATFEVYTN